MHRDPMSSRKYYVILLFIAALSIWIRTGFPLYAWPEMRFDDDLFIRLARSLETGHWLGLYDNLTLAKGMFYPLFIVIAFWTSVPLKIAEQVVYLLASLLTAGMARRQTRDNRLSLILFALLAFNPVAWNFHFARVLRQCLYMSLSLALFTLVVIVAFPTPDESNHGLRRVVRQGTGLGLLTAAYWLTREEGAWLLPALAVVLAVALAGMALPNWRQADEEETSARPPVRLKRIAQTLALAVAVFTAADGLVAGINYHHYGIFETNEFRSKSFLRAYGALSRIQHDHWHRFITFPKDARQRAYAVSPAARELASSYEGETGKRWIQTSCSIVKIAPCEEVEAGWAVWEFRDAVANAGHYRSGQEAMSYYDTLADQINSACDRGTIQCLPARATILPPFRREYLVESFWASKKIARVLFRMVEGPVFGWSPNSVSSQGLSIFADTVDGVYLPTKQSIVISGWTAAASATPTLHVVAQATEQEESSISVTPAPDVEKAYPKLKSVRFQLKTDCPPTACDLILEVAGSSPSRISLEQLLHSVSNTHLFETQGSMLNVESVYGLDSRRFTDSRRAVQVKVAGVIGSTYATAFPIMATLGAAGLLLATFFRRHFSLPTSLLALGLGSAVAVVTLLMLLSYLAASSDFTVNNVLYTSAASPFVITFTTIGIYSLMAAFGNRYRQLFHRQPSVRIEVAELNSSRPTPSGLVGV